MVLIDTSIWISLFRKNEENLGKKILSLVADNQAALCGQVWVEFLGGFRKQAVRKFHEKSLINFPFLETTRQAFHMAADLLGDYPHLGAGDAIIAATAMVNDAALLTLDKDFFSLSKSGLRLF